MRGRPPGSAAAAAPNVHCSRPAWGDVWTSEGDEGNRGRGFPTAVDQVFPGEAPEATPVVEAISGFAAPQEDPSRLVFQPYVEASSRVVTLNTGSTAIMHSRRAVPVECIGTELAALPPTETVDMARRLAATGGATTITHSRNASNAAKQLAFDMALVGPTPWVGRHRGG